MRINDVFPATLNKVYARCKNAVSDLFWRVHQQPQQSLDSLEDVVVDYGEGLIVQQVSESRCILRFGSGGEIEASKAELLDYGSFFHTFLNSELYQYSGRVRLVVNGPAKIVSGVEVYNKFEITEEIFRSIISFSRGEAELDFENLEAFEAVKAAADYFGIERLKKYTSLTFVDEHHLEKMDLTQYKGVITDEDIDRIFKLPCLRRAEGMIDLTALFPKLRIMDESVWEALLKKAGWDLKILKKYRRVELKAIDPRSAIKTVHEMFRTLTLERDAGITLLAMPAQLTWNMLHAITLYPFAGAVGCLADPGIENVYGEASIRKAYTIAITNSMLDGSRNLSIQAQHELLREKGCEMPLFLELSTLHLLTRIFFREDKLRYEYSRVAEKIDLLPLVIGNFGRSPIVNIDSMRGDQCVDTGVAAVRMV